MELEFAKKVLLVDDDTNFLMEAKKGLEEENQRIDVITSSSANNGLDLLEEKNFDAIVSGYDMQEMSGIRFLNKVRKEKGIEIPFILFTKKNKKEIFLKSLRFGANRVFDKEDHILFSDKILAKIIGQEIQNYENKKELEHYRKEFKRNFEIYL